MTATTARFTMLAVRLANGRYLVRRGNKVAVVSSYHAAFHGQMGPAEACMGGEMACCILRRHAREAGIEGADSADIVAVDNDDLATLRVWTES